MSVKLLTEHHLEFPKLKGGCTGSSESTLVRIATTLEISCRGSYYDCVASRSGSSSSFIRFDFGPVCGSPHSSIWACI